MYKNIYDTSIREIYYAILKKIGFKIDYSKINLNKNYSPTLLIDRFDRYLKVIKNKHTNYDIEFKHKKVLENGSGLNFGWLPLAISKDCKKYTIIEPLANKNFLKSSKNNFYFELFYKQIVSLSKYSKTYSDFKAEIKKKSECFINIEEIDQDNKFDIILSNSVLEHITDLEFFLKNLSNLCHKDTIHMHCVDFGNHLSSNDVFNKIYNEKPFSKKNVKGINFLRPIDIKEIFLKNKIKVNEIVYLSFDIKNNNISKYWDKYNKDELKKGVVFFIK